MGCQILIPGESWCPSGQPVWAAWMAGRRLLPGQRVQESAWFGEEGNKPAGTDSASGPSTASTGNGRARS